MSERYPGRINQPKAIHLGRALDAANNCKVVPAERGESDRVVLHGPADDVDAAIGGLLAAAEESVTIVVDGLMVARLNVERRRLSVRASRRLAVDVEAAAHRSVA